MRLTGGSLPRVVTDQSEDSLHREQESQSTFAREGNPGNKNINREYKIINK